MNKIIFIADFFVDQINGGGELNNEEVIKLLSSEYEILKINSNLCDLQFIKSNKDNFFIVANFALLHSSCKEYLENYCKYIIYEHDHKYLKSRNPADYKDFTAPPDQIINLNFYKNALAVLCQSSFHKNIILKNLNISNVINLSGNLWSLETLRLLEEFSNIEKKDKVSIMFSNTWHKNTNYSIEYCKYKNYEYELIYPCKPEEFLGKIANNKKLAFFPKTPETLSRIVVEARMTNVSVITNNNVGASYENWFNLKGKDLINLMKNKREQVINIIKGIINENNISL